MSSHLVLYLLTVWQDIVLISNSKAAELCVCVCVGSPLSTSAWIPPQNPLGSTSKVYGTDLGTILRAAWEGTCADHIHDEISFNALEKPRFFLFQEIANYLVFCPFPLDWPKPRSAFRWQTILPLALKECFLRRVDLGQKCIFAMMGITTSHRETRLKRKFLPKEKGEITKRPVITLLKPTASIIGLLFMLEDLSFPSLLYSGTC